MITQVHGLREFASRKGASVVYMASTAVGGLEAAATKVSSSSHLT